MIQCFVFVGDDWRMFQNVLPTECTSGLDSFMIIPKHKHVNDVRTELRPLFKEVIILITKIYQMPGINDNYSLRKDVYILE